MRALGAATDERTEEEGCVVVVVVFTDADADNDGDDDDEKFLPGSQVVHLPRFYLSTIFERTRTRLRQRNERKGSKIKQLGPRPRPQNAICSRA